MVDWYKEIENERAYQDRKWGIQDHKNPWWLTILAEEFGEVAKKVYDFTVSKEDDYEKDEHELELEQELIQVAAVCVAWLESMERKNGR